MTDDITPAAMRAVLETQGAGAIAHPFGGVQVTLKRDGPVWELQLFDLDGPVSHATCDRIATAVSAPSLDGWQRNDNGTIVRAEWCEGWPPVRMVER